MKPAHVLLQVLLVVVGLLVYDQLRGDEPVAWTDATPPEGVVEVSTAAQGADTAALDARFRQLGRRIAALETRFEAVARDGAEVLLH